MLLVVVVSVTHLIQECITLERNGDYMICGNGAVKENRFYVCATIWEAVFSRLNNHVLKYPTIHVAFRLNFA
jgi:hypothetical protein